jgi:hypothetical protein
LVVDLIRKAGKAGFLTTARRKTKNVEWEGAEQGILNHGILGIHGKR